ncbi:MAG: universal stress protein [Syntrophales bacterium]|jgi:nucleotide-binding universal stress UspA family protein
MFRKILYPTDFSETAEKAIPFLIQLKNTGIEEVIIFHVIDTYRLRFPSIYAPTNLISFIDKMSNEAAEKAKIVAEKLNAAGIKAHVRIEQGLPLREILRVESEEEVSIIVIGSHGRSNIEEMFLGSVSENVVRKAKSPVLVVKR